MFDLILVRHGQTDWNREDRVMGPKPIPLNETGRAQAAQVGEWLASIPLAAVYSSPMRRAMETAEIIARGHDGLKVLPEPGIAEIDYGDWVGLSFSEVRSRYTQYYDDYRFCPSKVSIPCGEKMTEVLSRCEATVTQIRARHDGNKVVIVSHSDIIKTIVIHFLGLPLDSVQKIACDNGCMTVLRFGTDWGDRVTALNFFAPLTKVFRNLYTGPSL